MWAGLAAGLLLGAMPHLSDLGVDLFWDLSLQEHHASALHDLQTEACMLVTGHSKTFSCQACKPAEQPFTAEVWHIIVH